MPKKLPENADLAALQFKPIVNHSFSKVVELYTPMVDRAMNAKRVPDEFHEDLRQSMFNELWRTRHLFNPEKGPLGLYMKRFHIPLQLHRFFSKRDSAIKRGTAVHRNELLPIDFNGPKAANSTSEQNASYWMPMVESSEQALILNDLLSQLPAKELQIAELDLLGYSNKEIAEMIGRNIETTRLIRYDYQLKLKHRLKEGFRPVVPTTKKHVKYTDAYWKAWFEITMQSWPRIIMDMKQWDKVCAKL